MSPMPFPNPESDFNLIHSTSGRGIYASASPNYRDAVFGRDSLEAAEDMVGIKPNLKPLQPTRSTISPPNRTRKIG